MTQVRLVGLVLLMLGAFAAYFGFEDARSDFGLRALDGYIDTSRTYIFGGVATAIVGLLTIVFAKRA